MVRPKPSAKSLANLKPARKGEVRNPLGRPPTPPDIKEALEAMLPNAVNRLGQLVLSENEKVALQAVQVVLERNLGKAIATKIDVKANLNTLHLEALRLIEARRADRMKTIEGTQNPSEIVLPKPNKTEDPEISS